MKLLATLLAAGLAYANAQCDQEYACEFKSPDAFGAFYDMRPLCKAGEPYHHTNTNGVSFYWNICGTAQTDCVPHGYEVTYQRGVAVQFWGEKPVNQTCINKSGVEVNCTRPCEVLGVGLPSFTLIDKTKPFAGVNISFYGVQSPVGSPYECPYDPEIGAPADRKLTVELHCNRTAVEAPHIVSAQEVGPCKYRIVMSSVYGCGCEPFCYNRNCGQDSCRGYCGAVTRKGGCPGNHVCTAQGRCCKPACKSPSGGTLQCGSDQCGGSCGVCQVGQVCNKYQQCVPEYASPTPSPSPMPLTIISTTSGGDKFAAFIGGGVSAAVVGMGSAWYMRLRKQYAQVN